MVQYRPRQGKRGVCTMVRVTLQTKAAFMTSLHRIFFYIFFAIAFFIFCFHYLLKAGTRQLHRVRYGYHAEKQQKEYGDDFFHFFECKYAVPPRLLQCCCCLSYGL